MQKSFYYLVSHSDLYHKLTALSKLEIEYDVERIDGQLAIVFPDLPVRQYAEVHALFGCVGQTY